MIWAVVPVKDLAGAKNRLSDVLSPDERHALAVAMLHDVLDALANTPALDGIAVITRDPEAEALAQAVGAQIWREERNSGESAAVEFAARQCVQRSIPAMLVIPGDAPLVRPEDVQSVLAADSGQPGLVLVSSRDGTGSNAVLRRPPDAIGSHFGATSFREHQEEAAACGIPVRTVRNFRLELDVDTPDDLGLFVAYENVPSLRPRRTTRAYAALERLGLAKRLAELPFSLRAKQ
ncbi:MAG: 2-phospho-L-lactate guanylyltransferase [Dehalococcoidia bacterium]|nr:2-phospho-L-lactate guanylyltransferase [Dehalococcoidia bacterium]